MASNPRNPEDDDALHWAGDDESEVSLPNGWAAKGPGSERVTHDVPAAGGDTVTDPSADGVHGGSICLASAAAPASTVVVPVTMRVGSGDAIFADGFD